MSIEAKKTMASESVAKKSIAKNSLTEGPIGKQLTNMALPMAIGILATMSFNVVDTFFVSSLGCGALAALSFTFPVVMLLVSLSIGLGAGTSSVVSFAAGQGDEQAVKELTTDAMTLTAILSSVLAVLGLLTMEPLFRLLGAEDHILPMITDYMQIWFVSIIFLAVPMVGLASVRALGDTRLQGVMMIVIAVANAILDPFLIFGIGPFPRLEIQGAALATLIVRIASLFVLFYWLRVKLDILVSPFNYSRLIASSRKLLHIGIPAMATNMIIPVSGAIIIALVATHGTDAVAGFGVATRIEAIFLILFYALSAVVGPFCGQNLGAKQFERLHYCQNLILKFCFYSGIVIAGILALLGGWIASLFSDDPAVIEVTKYYLMVVPISYFAYGVVMSVNASFNGLRKPLPGVVISSARVIFVLLPLAWLGNYLWGVMGLTVAIALANLVVGAVAFFWVKATITQLASRELV